MLPNWAFDCPAYRSLKPGPRALLWELIRRHNGTNNGRIVFSQRDMSEAINVSDRETVAGYVRDLEAKGFIVARRRGGFNVKVADRRASEWGLTWLPIGEELATKEFMRWRPEENGGTGKPAREDGKPVLESRGSVRHCSNVRKIPSLPPHIETNSGAEIPSTYTSEAIGRVGAGSAKTLGVTAEIGRDTAYC